MNLGITPLLLIGSLAVITALKKECPPKESMTCSCNKIYGPSIFCNGVNIQRDEDLKSNLDAMKGYEINRFALKDITINEPEKMYSFEGQHIFHLSLDNINVIEDSFEEGLEFFKGLEDSLKVLDFAKCFTLGKPLKHFKVSHLHKLEALNMHDNNLIEIGNDWFPDGPHSLKTLLLSRNGIKKVGDRAFSSLGNLQILWITDSPLAKITRSMFQMPAPKIQKISFARNKISKLPIDIFSDMPNLESVILDDNLIKTIQEHVPHDGLHQQIKYYLKGNPIRCDNEVKWLCDGGRADIDYFSCDSPEEKKGIIFRAFCDMES